MFINNRHVQIGRMFRYNNKELMINPPKSCCRDCIMTRNKLLEMPFKSCLANFCKEVLNEILCELASLHIVDIIYKNKIVYRTCI